MPPAYLLRKPLAQLMADAQEGERTLHRALGPLDLVMLGIGAIIGTGIFVLTGVAAVDHAGPAVVLSFAVAGVASALAALCYAEFATMIPIAGSAYSYSYATLGELAAWIIGWDLILEYGVASAAVASGWSGYFRVMLEGIGLPIPAALAQAPEAAELDLLRGILQWIGLPVPAALAGAPANGAVMNLPALGILVAITALLVIGIRESATTNSLIVALKLVVILFVIAAGAGYVQPANWQPFAPFGWNGIMAGGAIVFFAYIGFDAVTTAAEESRRPERDMPIGILGSLGVCTLLYLLVAAVVTGMVPLEQIDKTAPLATAFRERGRDFAAGLISVGAIVGLTSVLLVLLLGQSRIFFAMSRDGLLPPLFGRVHPRFRTPHLSTILVGGVVSLLAAFFPLTLIVELVSIGTLFAFVLVSAGVIVMRQIAPDQHRAFRCPWADLDLRRGRLPWIPLASIAACGYLMASLPLATWFRFVVWLLAGLAIYGLYGRHHSRVALAARAGGPVGK
jgi:APA family basic amino acid/polyamine antiporter